MFNIRFNPHYKVVNFTTEIGKYIVGGVATFIDEFYKYHTEDMGFVHIYEDNLVNQISLEMYPGDRDILALSFNEINLLSNLSFDIAVVHFFGLSFVANEQIIKDKKLIYVLHSVPTTEPYSINDPFGGNLDVKGSFEALCSRADLLVCVSEAEKEKLGILYPQYKDKAKVIYNGLDYKDSLKTEPVIRNERKIFGYMGRLDYRKGLLECIKNFKYIDGELRIACGNDDPFYLNTILNYIEAADLQDKVKFYGWCGGERKINFLNSLDALIIPSLYEPFGYVALEAMDEKIPIIVSSKGGLGEIIGEYKYSFDAYEPNALKNCILEFQQDSCNIIKQEIDKLFARNNLFTSSIMIDKYKDLFCQLI
ncbi:MAG: glycosyltransferase family 4 protein [Bacillota bacterium]|nr:glycosyltransferase family 4 protein [Bacillota bacterium]